MSKILLAATLATLVGLTGCATIEEPEAPKVASTTSTAPSAVQREQKLVTGSRLPGPRSEMVSATDASDAQRQLRDNPRPYAHK